MNLTTKNLLLTLRNNSIIKKNSFRFKLSKQNLILLELLKVHLLLDHLNFLRFHD